MCHFFPFQIDWSCIREFVTHSTLPDSFIPYFPARHRHWQSGCFPGPRGSPPGQLSVSWDGGEMTWCNKMGRMTRVARVVLEPQGASFVLDIPDLGCRAHSVLTTLGKRLNHILVSSTVCGMDEMFLKFVSFFFPPTNSLSLLCLLQKGEFNKFGFSGLACR